MKYDDLWFFLQTPSPINFRWLISFYKACNLNINLFFTSSQTLYKLYTFYPRIVLAYPHRFLLHPLFDQQVRSSMLECTLNTFTIFGWSRFSLVIRRIEKSRLNWWVLLHMESEKIKKITSAVKGAKASLNDFRAKKGKWSNTEVTKSAKYNQKKKSTFFMFLLLCFLVIFAKIIFLDLKHIQSKKEENDRIFV